MSDVGFSALVVGFGRSLVDWVAAMNVATGAILCAILLLDRLLERWISASWRLALYAAVGARLLLPVNWRSPLGLLGGAPPADFAPIEGPISIVALVPLEQTTPAWGASGWATIVYAAVALALLVRWTHARLALRAQLRSVELLESRVGSIPVAKHVEVGPLVAGLWRPRIVVPSALLESSRAESLAWVLRHEAAHVQRRDPLLGALVQIICILAWPILPVWIAARRVRALMEIACDERAIAGADGPARRRYGETLLALAEEPALAKPLGPVLSFGSPLRGRLRALTARRRWPLAGQATVVAGLAALAVACAGEPEWAEIPELPDANSQADTSDATDAEWHASSLATGRSGGGALPEGPTGLVPSASDLNPRRTKALIPSSMASGRDDISQSPASPARTDQEAKASHRSAAGKAARTASAPIVSVSSDGTLWLRTRRGGSTRVNDLHGLERSLRKALRESASPAVLFQVADNAPKSLVEEVQLVARRAGATDIGLWRLDNVMILGKGIRPRHADVVLTVTAAGSLFIDDQPVASEALEETLRVALSRRGADTLLLRGQTENNVVPDVMAIAKRAGARNVGILREPSPKPQVILTLTKEGQTFVNNLRVPPDALENELRQAMEVARTNLVFLELDNQAPSPRSPRVVDIAHIAQRAGALKFGLLHQGDGGSTEGNPQHPGSPLPALPAPGAVMPGTASVQGSLDKEVIRRTIRRRINDVKACYERELAHTQKSFGGRVAVRFQIAPSGQVEKSDLQSSTLGSPPAENCIVKVVSDWRFPPPDGGGIVIVTYPFNFVPTGGRQ